MNSSSIWNAVCGVYSEQEEEERKQREIYFATLPQDVQDSMIECIGAISSEIANSVVGQLF